MSELCRADAWDQLSVDIIEPAIQIYRNTSDILKLVQVLSLVGFVYLVPSRLSLAHSVVSELAELTKVWPPRSSKHLPWL